MKKGLVIANIIYYLFTFTVGVLLAVFLPYFLMLHGESVSMIEKSLSEKNYSQAISIVGGYYDDEYVLQQDFPSGGGIVLFKAATLVPGADEEGNSVQDMKLHKAYAGFVYGIKNIYNINKTEHNQAIINVTDLSGKKHSIQVLDTDTDKNDTKDTNSTCEKAGFIYVDFDQESLGSISKIEIVDCNGNVFATINANLDYSERFFADATDFIDEYNADFKSDKLNELNNEFLAKSEHYKISSDGVVKSSADKKSAIIVVVYFIGIYLIGDSLIGKRYVIKFFKWLFVKVFKIKPKHKKAKKEEVFGHDYFCKLTMTCDVSEAEGFDGSIQVRYSNQGGEVQFTLMKDKNYTDTQQVKAGDYVNLWVDVDKNYTAQGLPDTLEVEGYQKQITFKLKREERSI